MSQAPAALHKKARCSKDQLHKKRGCETVLYKSECIYAESAKLCT